MNKLLELLNMLATNDDRFSFVTGSIFGTSLFIGMEYQLFHSIISFLGSCVIALFSGFFGVLGKDAYNAALVWSKEKRLQWKTKKRPSQRK